MLMWYASVIVGYDERKTELSIHHSTLNKTPAEQRTQIYP